MAMIGSEGGTRSLDNGSYGTGLLRVHRLGFGIQGLGLRGQQFRVVGLGYRVYVGIS